MSIIALLTAAFVVASVAAFKCGQAGWACLASRTTKGGEANSANATGDAPRPSGALFDCVALFGAFLALASVGWTWPMAWKATIDVGGSNSATSSKADPPSSLGAFVDLEAALIVSFALCQVQHIEIVCSRSNVSPFFHLLAAA